MQTSISENQWKEGEREREREREYLERDGLVVATWKVRR